jgi:large subunit ribosomal protein L10
MNRTEKAGVVEQLAGRLERSPTLYLADFTGLTVPQVTEFRRRMRAIGVEYVVVKNRLAKRAFEPAAGLETHLEGPTGVVFADADPLGAAQVLADFAREFSRPKVKAGFMNGRTIEAAHVVRLATLPPREQLLAQAGGALQAPLAVFAGALNGLLSTFIGALDALREQRAGTAS